MKTIPILLTGYYSVKKKKASITICFRYARMLLRKKKLHSKVAFPQYFYSYFFQKWNRIKQTEFPGYLINILVNSRFYAESMFDMLSKLMHRLKMKNISRKNSLLKFHLRQRTKNFILYFLHVLNTICSVIYYICFAKYCEIWYVLKSLPKFIKYKIQNMLY